MTVPKVSVILPVFNSEKFIHEAVTSILNQTFKDFELIIIDDKSSDTSQKIIQSFNDPRIILIKNPQNIGITKSLNVGFASAKGDYVARMDADDISLPERLSKQVSYLDKHPEINVVGSYVQAFGRINGVWKYLTSAEDLRCNLLFNSSMAHPSVMFRKELRYGPAFTTAQDYDLWTRSGPRVNLPMVLLKYRTHDDQIGAKNYNERISLIEKIRRRELAKFGIKFSDAEFKLHNQIAFGKYGKNLTEIENWLTKIKLHNKKVNVFNQKSLEKVLDGLWFQACLANKSLYYFRSNLFKPSLKSLPRALVIFTKTDNKVLYILPDHNPKTPTHYAHLHEMLELLKKDLPLMLLVENQSFLIRPFLILRAVLQGYKTVYVHYSYAGAIFAAALARPLGGRVFYWHCEVFDKLKPLDKFPLWLTLKLVSRLVTGTESVKSAYQETFSLPGEKITVIPNWVNLQRFAVKKPPRQSTAKKTVLFAHRLAPRKGADFLPEIISKVPSAVFVIAGGGGGPLEGWLKERLQKGVVFKKSVPNVAMPKLMAASDLLIMPSRQEGFPRILIEAMAAGLPFVATSVGGVSDITSPLQQKYLVKKGNLEQFTQKINFLLKNPPELKKLSLDGNSWVQKFDINIIEKKFVDLFTK